MQAATKMKAKGRKLQHPVKRHVACFHSEAEGKIIKTRTMLSLQLDLSAVCLQLIKRNWGFCRGSQKFDSLYCYPFFVVGWLELLKLFFFSLCQDARQKFRSVLVEATVKLDELMKKIGKAVDESKPYWEARRLARQVSQQFSGGKGKQVLSLFNSGVM